MPVEIWKIYHRMNPSPPPTPTTPTPHPVFFGTRKSLLKKSREGFLRTCSMAPSSAGCPWPSVDLLSCSWSEGAWASLLEGVMSPTPIGHLISEFWMICTCPEGSAKPGQILLSELLLGSVHYRLAPLGGPTFLGVKGFRPHRLGSLAEELAAWLLRLEKKLQFCWFYWPFQKDCLPSSSWLHGGPNLWCTGCFRCWLLRNFEVCSQAPVKGMLFPHCKDLCIKLLDVRA